MFDACVGTELTETLCDELEIEMTLVSPVPMHYTDTLKRPDAEKWKASEKVEIKNCFDNDTEGNETQCKVRLNCDVRYQSESTYSVTFAPTSSATS